MKTQMPLAQCHELVYILIGDLCDLLEEPASPENLRWIQAVVDGLLENVPAEFALKCEQGYLSTVLEEFPNWEGQVTRLEDEYFSLCRQLTQLRKRIDSEQNYQAIAEDVSRDLMAWMETFRQHLQSEQKLVMLAANLEVGGED